MELCSFVLEEKCLLPPLDVETDLSSTSVDDSSPSVQEWPPNSDAEVLQSPLGNSVKTQRLLILQLLLHSLPIHH